MINLDMNIIHGMALLMRKYYIYQNLINFFYKLISNKTIKSGPANYDNDKYTTFTHNTQPISKLGYVLGARTDQRKFYSTETRAPSPTHYQEKILNEVPKPSLKPFNQSANRFQKENKMANLPG